MSGQTSTKTESNSYLSELSKDLRALLDHSDALLKCGGVQIPVHKCILSARSPVFDAMFRSQMRGAQSGIVDIVDMEPGVLQVLLKYLYSGKINGLTETMAEDLLVAADKYGLKVLKRICREKLKSILSRDNIFRILILGDFYDTHLKAHAKEFMCKSKFSELEKTEDWKSLEEEYPKLAMEVMRSIVKFVQDSPHQIIANTYNITVRYEGIAIYLDVSPTTTIKIVKEQIQVKEDIPPHLQSLFYKSRLLQDHITVSGYDIYENSILILSQVGW